MVTGAGSDRKRRTSQAPVRYAPRSLNCHRSYLQICICIRPEKTDTGKPVFFVDQFSSSLEFFWSHDAHRRARFGSCNLATNRARRNPDLRIVADALEFSALARGHEKKLSVSFGKPDRGRNPDTALAERGEADVLPTADGRRNRRGHKVAL